MDSDFQAKTIRPVTEKLANKFLLAINPQLLAIGATKVAEGRDPGQFWDDCVDDMTDMFTRAFIVKGCMRASPHYYSHSWIRTGSELKRDHMKEIPENLGAREVTYCATPVVQMRRKKGEEWKVISPARVFARQKN